MNVREDFAKPINALSLGVGLVSLILSIAFYFGSRQSAEPTYLIDEDRPKVFDSSLRSPKLRVVTSDGAVVTRDIFVATITVWNAGELPIDPEQVRRPVSLTLDSDASLLDWRVEKQTDSEIMRARLVKDEEKNGVLSLRWQHFDPGFGVKVVLVYAGRQDARIGIDGSMVGAKLRDGRAFVERNRINSIVGDVLQFLGFAILLLATFMIDKEGYALKAIALVVSTAVAGVLIYMLLFRDLAPPF